MRKIMGLSFFFLVMMVLITFTNQVDAVCCFPYDTNYYIDPETENLVINGELTNDSYLGEPFGNTNYRFAFYDEDRNPLLEQNILLTDLLPIKGGVVIPPPTTFPFQITLTDIDDAIIRQSNNFGVDGTNTIDYFAWKPADLVISPTKLTLIDTIHGKNGDAFDKWELSGNITNTHSEKTNNVYVVASLRDKNDGMVGIAGYSDDSIQPFVLNGFETKGFALYGLVPKSKTPSKANLYAESDESSFVHQYYRPINLGIPEYSMKQTTDPRKPVPISINMTNTSRQSFDLDWIIQIKKSPKSVSDGNLSKDQSKVVYIQKIPVRLDGQQSIRLDHTWIPQANGFYFYEMYLWDDSQPLSYSFTGTFLHDNWIFVNSNLNSITNQIKSGIPLDEVQCREGLRLVHKASNGNLICVKPETMQILIERGWAKTSIITEERFVVPRSDLFLQRPLIIEDLNQTQYAGQKIQFTVKYNGTKSGCQNYPSLRIEDSKHQKVWESNYILELCDPDTTPTHVEKEWKIGNSALGTPIINMTGSYTLFAEFESYITQHDFWVIEKTPQVKIVKGSASQEQMENYFPKSILVIIGINNTVTWVNEDDTPSSVTSDKEDLFSSGPINPGQNWTHAFEKSGLYEYHSEPHPWMRGAVIVILQNAELLSKQEKQDIAWYILQPYFPNPITALGVDNEGVLVVGIHQDELKKTPNAESYYIKKFQKIIPFHAPIKIQFGHVDLQ